MIISRVATLESAGKWDYYHRQWICGIYELQLVQDPVTGLFALIPDAVLSFRGIVRQEPPNSILAPLTMAHALVGDCGSRQNSFLRTKFTRNTLCFRMELSL